MGELRHDSVLLEEVLRFLPEGPASSLLLDVTAGGAGHLSEMLKARPSWRGEAWDRDPDAPARIEARARSEGVWERVDFRAQTFGEGPKDSARRYSYILADLGVSSFQLDDPARGMSLHSDKKPDFRMDPAHGPDFLSWLDATDERTLARIFDRYGEEPRAAKAAREMKTWGASSFTSAKVLADHITRALGYKSESRIHPATRIFQALRIAVNDELGELEKLLQWGPASLAPGGRLAIISFHSLEDRLVKLRFKQLEDEGAFVPLTKKPIIASEEETAVNRRSRSAKLRILERAP